MSYKYAGGDGDARISVSALEKLANMAAMEVDGVKSISSYTPEYRTLITRYLPKKKTNVIFLDGVAEITIGITLKYGYRVPDVTKQVQEHVKSVVQDVTEITVSRVNVVVCGVAADMDY